MERIPCNPFPMKRSNGKHLAAVLYLFFSLTLQAQQTATPWITFEPPAGNTIGKHIVLICGDEEYRSEEGLPMLAGILSQIHGFRCTVLFSQDANGEINPDNQTNIPGLKNLETADLLVMCLRFRELPDEQMKYFDSYVRQGKPIVGLRTSTHAFRYTRNKQSPYAKYGTDSKEKGWEKGFGKNVLGETWVAHHGEHGTEGTRGVINGLKENHPLLKGVRDIWGFTDVYTISSLDNDSQVLVFGLPTTALTPDSPPNYSKSVMPIAWVRSYKSESGKVARIFNTTMGASVDLANEDLRRLLVNACYWGMGMESQITERADVGIRGKYQPTMFGTGNYKKGMKPSDFKMN
jgi:type 1 glutamine amidotransferase